MFARTRELVHRLICVTLAAIALGILAGVGQALAQGVNLLEGVLRGLCIGLFSGLSIGSLELIFDRGPLMWQVRRLPGGFVQTIRFTFFFTSLFVSICLGLWVASTLVGNPIETDMWYRLIASSSLLALALALMLLPIFKIMQILTLPTLIRAMLGQYLHPNSEERGILFMDLKGSTQLIERIGDKAFLRFLNEILFQINGIILKHKGEIYRYVGDEFIITWPEQHLQGSLDCIIEIQNRLESNADKFKRRFGCEPEFRFGLHFGEVLVGELGDLRAEIALIGDAINTTKRIEDVCRHFPFDVLVSDVYLERVNCPTHTRPVPVEEIRLRGKKDRMQLYGIKRMPHS